jgi:hypothetical protein
MKRRYALLDLHGKDQLDYNLGSQLRLRGEVHRVVAARDQKYQSNFVEVCKSPRLFPLSALSRPILVSPSSGTTRLYTVAMQASSSAYVLMQTTTNLHTWRPYTCLSRFSVRSVHLPRDRGLPRWLIQKKQMPSSTMSASWTWCSISTRCVTTF